MIEFLKGIKVKYHKIIYFIEKYIYCTIHCNYL